VGEGLTLILNFLQGRRGLLTGLNIIVEQSFPKWHGNSSFVIPIMLTSSVADFTMDDKTAEERAIIARKLGVLKTV
jgi:hypothetical protein